MLTITPGEVHPQKLYHYLTGAVGPRPIAFASTIDAAGNPNLAPFSFFNVFSSNPPILVFSPVRSGRTNTTKNTLDNVKEVAEVVINIVNYDIVQQMSLASSPYDKDINEFLKSGLTPIESDVVQPFRVKESPVQFECKVNEVIELGQTGGAGNLVICEVLKIHIDESILDENETIDQHKIDLVSRMGGNWYCRANEGSMFEITKPITTVGIGVDAIPFYIKNSSVLTGNDLGKLGSVEAIPNETDVNDYKLIELSDIFVELEDHQPELEQKLHSIAKGLLVDNKLEDAWKTLLAFND
jgi:flavin reductase (DIM6/NTAB) family NADH-FMN oxidoreductase RutF